MISSTDIHFIHEFSNYFILNKISFTDVKSLLLLQIIQSAQNNIQTFLFSYQKRAPNSQEITGNSQLK